MATPVCDIQYNLWSALIYSISLEDYELMSDDLRRYSDGYLI